MNTNNGASKSNTQTTTPPNQPLPGAAVSSLNDALSSLYQYQQSWMSQQVIAQQQVSVSSISIKVATEQAAARAAEISKLLKGADNSSPKENAEPAAKRENSVSKSCSHSPSDSRSSKSKSASPTRYRSSYAEHKKYSPRGQRGYWGYRYSSYNIRGYNDRRDYHRSSYRRYDDRSRGREYSYYHRNRSRSGSRSRRTPSGSRSLRYHQSRSPRRHCSPSPRSYQKMSGRDRHSLARSPVKGSRISSSPHHARTGSPRKILDRSSSSSRKSKSCSSSSLSMKDNKAKDYSSTEANNSEVDLKEQKNEHGPSRKQFTESSRSSSPSSSESTSFDHSDKRVTLGPSFERTVSGKLTSVSDDHSSSSMSKDKVSTPRASSFNSGRSGPAVSTVRKAESGNYEDVDNRHDDSSGEGQNLNDYIVKRRAKQDSQETSSSNSHALSAGNSLTENGGHPDQCSSQDLPLSEKATLESLKLLIENELPQKAINGNGRPAPKTERKAEGKTNCTIQSEEMITADNLVNEHIYFTNVGENNHDRDRNPFDYQNIYSEHGVFPMSNVDVNMDGRHVDEHKQEPEYNIGTPVRLPDVAWVEPEHVTVYMYPEERPKQRSRCRERRHTHGKKHHKRRRREDSEEDDAREETRLSERKLRRHSRSHRGHHKCRSEKKRRKRKQWDTSSTSSSGASSSSKDKISNECYNVLNKRPFGSKKKRLCSLGE